MITAVDTNILLDILLPDPSHGEKSLESLEAAYEKSALVICGEVCAELSPQFDDLGLLDTMLSKIGIEVVPLDRDACYFAGRMWLEYRKKSKTRDRIITDFLIGAFAKIQAERLLTRDRGFYRKDFHELNIL